MYLYNIDIRQLADEKELQFKQIAKKMGVSRVYLSRIMCAPLSSKNRARITNAIKQLVVEREGAHE